jgi:predicted ATPase
MARPSALRDGGSLSPNGGNLPAVLAARQREHPGFYEKLAAEFVRIMPEYDEVKVAEVAGGMAELRLSFQGDADWISGGDLSQGTLCLLALLAVAYDPEPPSLVCIDEVDRGLHPRLLREVRDALYRLSYPEGAGGNRAAAQVVVTTHSPYLLDLFREHPEEVLIAGKTGRSASFSRLDEAPNLRELLGEGSLGDLWYSGILGGVPEER